MRCSVLCAVFVLLVFGVAEAETVRPPCNTVQVQGAGRVENQECDPKICDVLLYDGINGQAGGACTIQVAECTPLEGSPKKCEASDLVAANAGGHVTRNSYAPGSTREDATVFSSTIGREETRAIFESLIPRAEMDAILGSFDDSPRGGPPHVLRPLSEEERVALGERLAETESFMLGPNSLLLGPRGGIVAPQDVGARGDSPDEIPAVSGPLTFDSGSERQIWWRLPMPDTVESGVTEIPKTYTFIPPMSGQTDLTSGEHWGNSVLDDGSPSSARTWNEWERRLALQVAAGGEISETTRLDNINRAALEISLDELRTVYPPGSPLHQAVLSTHACLASGECATYQDGVRHLTDNLGIYGGAADRLTERITLALGDSEGVVRVLPDSAIYYDEAAIRQDENREMNEFMRLMPLVSEEDRQIADRLALQGPDGMRQAVEHLNGVVQHEAAMYEYDLLERAGLEFDEREAERRRLEQEAIERWYNTPPDPDELPPAETEADRIEAGVRARLEREAEEAAAETARLARLAEEAAAEARRAWERQWADEAALSAELERYRPLGDVRTVFPEGTNYSRQEVDVTDPETGERRTFFRGPDGYYRTSDALEVERYREWWDNWVEAGNIEAAALVDFDRRQRIEARLLADNAISDPVPFGRDSSVIPDTYRAEILAPAAQVIAGLRGDIAYIEVTGHASQGPGSSLLYNDNLSWQRAEEVRLFLSQHPGLAGVEIRSIGAGFRQPLSDVPRNDAAQQRVVIRIVYR